MKLKQQICAAALALFLAVPVYADFDEGQKEFMAGNYEQSCRAYKDSALSGDSRSQFSLALMCYEVGLGATQDYEKAAYWFEKAAQQGHIESKNSLALLYESGNGVDQDYQKAIYWYEQAAKKGHVNAQFKLALLYYNGQGVAQDFKQAFRWYEQAAKQGDAGAQNNLASLYDNGQGIAQDYKQATYWYEQAAKQGYAKAQFNLAQFYYDDRGVQDYKLALYWYEQAAKQGYSNAQFNLGAAYANGLGVLQDFIQAHKWMNIASASGHQDARRVRDQVIAPKMTPQQIQQAQALARTFLNGEVAPEPKAPQPAAPSITTGSGFVISKGGQIVTNAHVVEGCKSISVELGNQQTSATLQAADNTNDMAILKSSLTTTRPANLAAGRITLGQTAYAMGYPLRGLLGQDLQMTNGIISGLNGLQNDFRYYQINAAVQSGNSGGPLLNEQANVIGIVSMKLNVAFVNELVGDLPQNVNFAIKSTQLMGYLDANSVDYQVTSSGQKLSSSQVAERAREFTAFITCEK
ncbi:SEL1-like repeat protein [Thiomicrospira microaerophila]|uniref:trypsin-like peptidase domain-containing protein n=1 Tax=Thiomicrospira microaerophila TaxID=406020 RepID=UPI00200EE34C|nr:trypsin-like peptidase domain-containing protein [Thiomicrospira microaerophila]UQB42889.1 SEL1-like repeat protein [Thiomicrospira microaerophila]